MAVQDELLKKKPSTMEVAELNRMQRNQPRGVKARTHLADKALTQAGVGTAGRIATPIKDIGSGPLSTLAVGPRVIAGGAKDVARGAANIGRAIKSTVTGQPANYDTGPLSSTRFIEDVQTGYKKLFGGGRKAEASAIPEINVPLLTDEQRAERRSGRRPVTIDVGEPSLIPKAGRGQPGVERIEQVPQELQGQLGEVAITDRPGLPQPLSGIDTPEEYNRRVAESGITPELLRDKSQDYLRAQPQGQPALETPQFRSGRGGFGAAFDMINQLAPHARQTARANWQKQLQSMGLSGAQAEKIYADISAQPQELEALRAQTDLTKRRTEGIPTAQQQQLSSLLKGRKEQAESRGKSRRALIGQALDLAKADPVGMSTDPTGTVRKYVDLLKEIGSEGEVTSQEQKPQRRKHKVTGEEILVYPDGRIEKAGQGG